MATTSSTPDISVRGGVLNIPHSTTPTRPPRHRPDTPRTKKHTKTRPDHQVHGGDSSTTVKDSPPPQPATAKEPPDEPAADSSDKAQQ